MKKRLLWISVALLASSVAHAAPTTKRGQDYVQECLDFGVPTPPDWPSPDWIFNGTLDKPLNPHDPASPSVFISRDLVAEVYYYDSSVDPTQPEGVCIGLPRFIPPRTGAGTDRIRLFGVICQGKQSGYACFWDNKDPTTGQNFILQRNQSVPIVGAPGASFAGGADLAENTEEQCTACHAGENAFVIHPESRDPDTSALALGDALLKPDQWYTPLVPESWPDNPGPGNPLEGVASTKSCLTCHGEGGHRFPQLSTELDGYCGPDGELESAMKYTMPAFQPQNQIFVPAIDDPGYAAHVAALQAACASAPALTPAQMMIPMD